MRAMPTSPAHAAAGPPTGPSSAAVIEVEGADGYPPLLLGGASFEIAREPSVLLLSEAAAIDEEDPHSMAFMAEFFQATLADYKAFRAHVLSEHVSNTDLAKALQTIAEVTMGRPTK
jgi:hypothetical protein